MKNLKLNNNLELGANMASTQMKCLWSTPLFPIVEDLRITLKSMVLKFGIQGQDAQGMVNCSF